MSQFHNTGNTDTCYNDGSFTSNVVVMDDIFLSHLRNEFTVKNGQLMRRRVAQYRFDTGAKTIEHLYPVGERLRFAGSLYRASHLAHFLQTGEWPTRINKRKAQVRYRAQVREGAKVLHLGYFASKEERDAAVFAYKLGIFPSGSKSA